MILSSLRCLQNEFEPKTQDRIPHSLNFELFIRDLPHNLCPSLTLLPFNFVNRGLTFDHWSFESHFGFSL